MYSTLFDLSIKDYAIHYIVMVVARWEHWLCFVIVAESNNSCVNSTVLLTMAYANISQGAFAK